MHNNMMLKARTSLLLRHRFYGMLAMRLELVEDRTQPTAWTDGVRIGYNPEWVAGLTEAERIGVLVHEIEHVARGHCWRRGLRDPKRWNVAADKAINGDLIAAGFALPGSGHFPSADERGKSAEWIYARMGNNDDAPGNGDEPGNDDAPGNGGESGNGDEPGNGGESGNDDAPGNDDGIGNDVRDYPADAEKPAEQAAQEWRQAVIQAHAIAKGSGSSIGERTVQASKPKTDWRAVLRRFFTENSQADYSFARPNRRYAASGVILPSLHSESIGRLAVAVDVSGSVDDVLLSTFGAEIQSIADEVQPSMIDVVWCDTRITRAASFAPGESIDWSAPGGGGTDFRPIFEHFNKSDDPIVGLVVLTDLMGVFPDDAPDYPVIWAKYGSSWRVDVPFGEVVEVEE